MQLATIGHTPRRSRVPSWLAIGCVMALPLTLLACQGPPPARPVTRTSAAALAVEALDRGDYARAADLYRDALAAEPESVPIHYGLGVASSYLDRKADAIREFTWVLDRAAGDSTEAMTARRWLESAGVRRRPAVLASEGQETAERPAASPREEEKPAPAIVTGRVVFDEIPGVVVPQKRAMLLLSDYPKREVYLRIRTDSDGRFRFADVPPGVYKLTDRVAGQPRWRLRLELKPGQEMALDLDPANSTRVRDDFPEPAEAAEPPSS